MQLDIRLRGERLGRWRNSNMSESWLGTDVSTSLLASKAPIHGHHGHCGAQVEEAHLSSLLMLQHFRAKTIKTAYMTEAAAPCVKHIRSKYN